MSSDYLKNLVHQYVEGTCSAEEMSLALDYLDTPEGQAYLATLIDRDIAQLLAEKRAMVPDTVVQTKGANTNRAYPPRRWYWAAASVAVLLVAWAVYRFSDPTPTVYQTAYGETQRILLSDSTVVTLNANSTLTYQSDDALREVWLKGEAFFEVKHLVKKADALKFIVYANDLAIEVTGTSFNVNNRRQTTQVVLNSGQVRLKEKQRGNQQPRILRMQPGDMVEVQENQANMVKKMVNPAVYSSWKDKKMICNDTPLPAIAEVIHDTFGKTVILKDPVSQKVITGTLPTDQLGLLLEVLSASLQLKIAQQADTIFIEEITSTP